MIEELQMAWESKWDDHYFIKYREVITNGLGELQKYYSCFDRKPSYLLTLGKHKFTLIQFELTNLAYSSSPILQTCIYQAHMGWCKGTG
jgi:hypothetical protein